MKWEDGRRSENIEDQTGRRNQRRQLVGGGGIGMILIAALLVWLQGGNIQQMFQAGFQAAQQQNAQVAPAEEDNAPAVDSPEIQQRKEFVSVTLASTEDVWKNIFQRAGQKYNEPVLVFFSGSVNSACGQADAAVGPFYCPGDEKVYLDLSFFDELERKFNAPGDFAQAYVVAHEIGHHVQNLLGTSEQVQRAQTRLSKEEGNQLSVRLELQADYFAGVWAHHAHKQRQVLEPGDIEEGITAAQAIGDDRLQKQARGYVVPDSFTHGTSQQRLKWFMKGLKSGDVTQGDTFKISYEDL